MRKRGLRYIKLQTRTGRCESCGQDGELLHSYLNYPVFYHCVGCDQGGELQGVPRDEPED